MTSEVYRRSGIPAVLLAILALLAVWLPKLISPPALVAAMDGACTDADLWSSANSPIPIVEFTYWLDSLVAEDHPALTAVMHGQSALLHILVVTVLLRLLLLLGVARIPSICGAAMFAVHPIAFEAVSIVSFRSTILSGLFALSALSLLAHRESAYRRTGLLAAGLCAALTAAADPFAALALPGFGYLVGVRVANRGWRYATGLAVPVLAVVAGYVAWPWSMAQLSLAKLTVPIVALFVPAAPAGLGEPLVTNGVGVAMICAVVLASALVLRRRQALLSMGFGMLAIAAIPALWAVPLLPDPAGYLVLVAAALLFAGLPISQRAHIGLTAVAVVLMTVVDWRRDVIYRSSAALYVAGGSQPLARCMLGECLADSDDGEVQQRAITVLEAALPDLPVTPRKARIQEAYVRVLTRQGRPGDASLAAEELCKSAETLGQRDGKLKAYLIAAECFSIENYAAKIEEYVGKASELAPDHPEVVAVRGERAFAALATAAGENKKPRWLDKDDPRVVAIDALADQALAADSECFRALLLKGRLLESRGDVLDALPYYEQAIVLAPLRTEPRLLLARLYMGNEMMEEAGTCVRAALQAGVDDPRLHFYLVMILTAKGQSSDARQYLEAYVKNHGESAQARVLLASLLSAHALQIQDQAQPAQLRALAARIERLNPEDPKGYLVRAAVLMRSKPPKFENYVKAIVLIENARLLMPKDPDVKRRLAIAHRDFGWKLYLSTKPESAMDHFQKFLTMAPAKVERGPVQRTYRSHCRKLQEQGLKDLREGLVSAAAKSFQRFTELLPLDGEGYFHLGLARMEASKLAAALGAFEKAISLGRAADRDVSPYLLPLLDTLHRMGRSAEASQRAKAFLKDPGPAGEALLEKIRQRVSK